MLSLILTSRVHGNPDSNIGRLLNGLKDCGGTKDNCEVLLKYDSDDIAAPDDAYFRQFPFKVKRFVWSRGEGRHSIHLDHFYLFSQRDMRSRFMLLSSDDFSFTHKGFVDEILAIPDEFCFVGPRRPQLERYRGHWREPAMMKVWKNNEGVSLPCISVRAIEVLQNWGWQANGDNWVTLLAILMFEKYGIDMWKTITPFFARNPTSGTSGYSKSFNNMEIDGSRDPANPYYFTLVEQQAKNLYLNMTEGQ